MQNTIYFYDLETSGINARSSRIMQFAGQRTDMQLNPIGEPDNILVKLSDDILPEPDAILITGITPQKVNSEGVSEVEFLRYFHNEIATPGTVFTGFNNVRFDDEFIRFCNYRNFYDAYEWSWKDSRGRWDILDVVRMTRALRPDGIEWPFDSSGKPSNRLQFITDVNKLEHSNAHDALSDVRATIAVTRMIYNKQYKLFNYLINMRDKKAVDKLVSTQKPFVYTSGKYPSAYEKTTVAVSLGEHPGKQGVLVYDLRHDPLVFADMSPAELVVEWQKKVEDETKRFPVKTLQLNRCPAVAPISVLDENSKKRISIDIEQINTNFKKLQLSNNLYQNLLSAIKIMDNKKQTSLVTDEFQVDSQLYDGFFNEQDKTAMSVVRAAEKSEIESLEITFNDERLNKLLPLYKARNFKDTLSSDEREKWEAYRTRKLIGGGMNSSAQRYFSRLGELAERKGLKPEERYLLEELQLYGQSILPITEN